MKHKIIVWIKNAGQILFNIICGHVMSWWFLYAYAFLTDKPDRAEETADLKAAGYFMLVTGIAAVVIKEFTMYRINRDIKKYLVYSLIPFIITAAALAFYIISIN